MVTYNKFFAITNWVTTDSSFSMKINKLDPKMVIKWASKPNYKGSNLTLVGMHQKFWFALAPVERTTWRNDAIFEMFAIWCVHTFLLLFACLLSFSEEIKYNQGIRPTDFHGSQQQYLLYPYVSRTLENYVRFKFTQ